MREPARLSPSPSPTPAPRAPPAGPAPQAPARNTSPAPPAPPPCPLDTYNSHRKIKRPRLGCSHVYRHVYRPARRRPLARIDETSPARPRSKSLQHSTDFSSTAPFARSRSNISADTSRSVPVCNQSHERARRDSSASDSTGRASRASRASPQYAEPRDSDSSDGARPRDRRASMSDAALALVPHGGYTYYRGDAVLNGNYKVKKAKHSNLYLAFMY